MKVYISKLHGERDTFYEAERSNNIRIETEQGVFSIQENKDGSLSINESTHRHLTISPRATNAVQLGTIDPSDFSARLGGK